MTARLGRHQIRLLVALGSPSMTLVVPSAVARSLERRGLVAPRAPARCDGFIGITAAGLRALADLYDAGALAAFLKLPERSAASDKRDGDADGR